MKFFRKLIVAFAVGFTALGGVWAGLETATYISSLNSSNPTATDPVSQADDHLRLVKSTLLATFPNITGAMTMSHTELNLLGTKSLTANGYQKMPSGLIMQWGAATTGAGTSTISFPVACPTATFSVVASNATSSTAGITIYAGNVSTTGFDLASSAGAGLTVYWQAYCH